jgi:hypothetical protein
MRVRKRHWQKLISLIKTELGIRVYHSAKKPALGNGRSTCWDVNNQSISIGTKNQAWLVYAILAHELGHCLSVRKGAMVDPNVYLDFIAFKLPLTKRQAQSILKEEARAWTLGFRFLRKHGLPVNGDMQYVRRCLLKHWKRGLIRYGKVRL